MLKLKKVLSAIITIILVFSLIQLPVNTKASVDKDGKVLVKVKFINYGTSLDGWNIWSWDTNHGGARYDFDGVDKDGAYKIFERGTEDKGLGLIVRKSITGNDWSQKCYSGDVNIDLSTGKDVEVVFDLATNSYKISDTINENFDKVTVNVHYYRFDGNYSDWDLYSWGPGKGGAPYTLADDPSGFGKIATFEYNNVTKISDIGYIVRQGGSSWSGREQSYLNDGNRQISNVTVNADGNVDVYIVQGDKNNYYEKSAAELAKSPKIFSSKIDTLKAVSFTTSFAVPSTDSVKLYQSTGSGTSEVLTPVSLAGVELASDGKSGTVTTTDNLDFVNSAYKLAITDSYSNEVKSLVTLGKIYGSDDFSSLYTYKGDLGAQYSSTSTKFVFWAPTATAVNIKLYGTEGSDLSNGVKDTVAMTKGDNGTWTATVDGDLNGDYYNYAVTVNGTVNEVVDPYAKAVGVNGQRGMVINLDDTDPTGWSVDPRPQLSSPTDATIYEMHIRDFTIAENSGVSLEYRGKFKGAWQSGTTIPGTDIKTGIDHLKELGVNTVQIMPTFDYNSVDETNLSKSQFNWGYDPLNYNSVEGSYSSDPYTANIRITEFKQLINALHKAGIRVTMDVVYNHTALSETSNLNQAVPNYYYRQNDNGGFSNGSGCGNELASERSMVRKLMVDSVVYWAKEFHIDGFRFDLMALIDTDTIKEIRSSLDEINPGISIIGEGWTGGSTSLSSDKQSLKANTGANFGESQIAAFSDDIRDGIKGNVFDGKATGFINGGTGFEETIKFGIVGSTQNDQIDYTKVKNGSKAWATEPYQSVNYTSAHDNLTLHDKLKTTNPTATEEELVTMNKMEAAIIYTSQGIPFMLSGEEFARTKTNADGTFNENSYNASDAVNAIDWSRKSTYNNLFQYYKGLIKLRNDHRLFKMASTKDIQNNLKFIDVTDSNVVAYTISGGYDMGDYWDKVAVLFNANKNSVSVKLPSKDWVVVVNGETAGGTALSEISGDTVTIPAQTSYVLVDKTSYDVASGYDNVTKDSVTPGQENVVTVANDVTAVDLTIKDIDNVKEAGGSITIRNSDGSNLLSLPFDAIPADVLAGASEVKVSLNKGENTGLSSITGLKNVVGKVYTFNVTVVKNGESIAVHQFDNNAVITAQIVLSDEELATLDLSKSITVYTYVPGTGITDAVKETTRNGNIITFKSTHLSSFVVANTQETATTTGTATSTTSTGSGTTTTNTTANTKTDSSTTLSSSKRTGDTNDLTKTATITLVSLVVIALMSGGYVINKRRKVNK